MTGVSGAAAARYCVPQAETPTIERKSPMGGTWPCSRDVAKRRIANRAGSLRPAPNTVAIGSFGRMVEDIIPAIGRTDFGRVAFDMFRREMDVHHLTICRYLDGRPVKLFAVESAIDERGFMSAIDYYIDSAYVNDPFRRAFRRSPCRELVTLSIDADHVADRRMRERLYYARGIVAKDSLVIRRAQDVLTLTVYRSGAMRPQNFSWISRWRGILAAAVERHVSIMEQPQTAGMPSLSELIEAIPATAPLSPQEIAVCGMIVAGHSTESIALNLGISPHSVVTYRRRAYAKLMLSSQNELFMQLLRQCHADPRQEPPGTSGGRPRAVSH
jgi:DNA-binding CsgD family transcriptional regulator